MTRRRLPLCELLLTLCLFVVFAGGPSEQIQLELVQLCTVLIQHAHTLFQEHKKELIELGW